MKRDKPQAVGLVVITKQCSPLKSLHCESEIIISYISDIYISDLSQNYLTLMIAEEKSKKQTWKEKENLLTKKNLIRLNGRANFVEIAIGLLQFSNRRRCSIFYRLYITKI